MNLFTITMKYLRIYAIHQIYRIVMIIL
ncbi:hypothetical protein [Sulfolobus tengchongensis spindle-shaped virus 4]|nr:hypothetical protein [Sulfolobus tengchongensis spindle-shaped virus 4]